MHWDQSSSSFSSTKKNYSGPLKEKVALCQRPRTFHSRYLTLIVDDSHVTRDPYFSQVILEVIKFLVLVWHCSARSSPFKFSSCQQLRQRVVIYITKGVFYVAKDSLQRRLFKGLLLLLQLKYFSLEQFYLPEAFRFLSWEPQHTVHISL